MDPNSSPNNDIAPIIDVSIKSGTLKSEGVGFLNDSKVHSKRFTTKSNQLFTS